MENTQMKHTVKGVTYDPDALDFRKSSASSGNTDNCLMVAFAEGGVVLRDSRNQHGGDQVYTDAEWAAFLVGVERGEFVRSTM
jgi:hypothetical protein